MHERRLQSVSAAHRGCAALWCWELRFICSICQLCCRKDYNAEGSSQLQVPSALERLTLPDYVFSPAHLIIELPHGLPVRGRKQRTGSELQAGNITSPRSLALHLSGQGRVIDLGERMVFTFLSLPKDVKNSFL